MYMYMHPLVHLAIIGCLLIMHKVCFEMLKYRNLYRELARNSNISLKSAYQTETALLYKLCTLYPYYRQQFNFSILLLLDTCGNCVQYFRR